MVYHIICIMSITYNIEGHCIPYNIEGQRHDTTIYI